MLRQVLRSQFVTHDQMFEFMKLGCHEIRRQSFNWRTKRLVDHQMVLRHYTPAVASTYVYSIGTLGFLYLQGICEYYAGAVCIPATRPADLNCFHSIELNELHLALAAAEFTDEWMPDIEIRSRNELSNQGYAKDHDAIVTLLFGSSRPRFALEYERSPKTFRQYDGIRKTTDRETRVDENLVSGRERPPPVVPHAVLRSNEKAPLYRVSQQVPSEIVGDSCSRGGDWPADEVRRDALTFRRLFHGFFTALSSSA